MGEQKGARVRRVGTATFGGMLVLFGLLFILHMFLLGLTYVWIFRLWPVMFITLGVEVLLSAGKAGERVVYDGIAMLLMGFLTLFAMGMAVADLIIQYQGRMYLG